MRIISTRIRDYGPFKGEHEFIFADRGLTIVLGRNLDEPRMNSNGSGKSSLFDAFDWCQNADVPRGDHVDSVIHDFSDEAQVTNYYDDDGTPLVVQRTKKRGKSGKVRYWKGGKEITTLDPKELQRRIFLDLGADREVFHATVLYAQGDQFNFASATDAQAMEILTKVLRIGEIDDLSDLLKSTAKATDDAVAALELDLAKLGGALVQANEQMDNFRAQAGVWEEERAQSLRAATVQLNEHLGHIEKARGVVAMEDRVRAMGSVLNPMGATVFDWRHFDQQINEAKSLENQWRDKQAMTKAEGQALRTRLDKLASIKVGATCSECEQPITGDHIAVEVTRLTAEREAKLQEYATQEVQLKAAVSHREMQEEAKATAHNLHMEAEKDLAARSAEANQQLKQIEETKDYLKKAEPHVDHLRSTMATTQSKLNPWTQQEEAQFLNKQTVQESLTAKEAEKKSLDETKAYYDFWKKAFGPSGLKNYILDARLKEMNDAANYWVKLITGGTFWVRIESQKMGRSTKRLSNKINTRVFRYNRDGTISDRNFKTWSGGEKKRIAWAIDFGLSRLIAARATKGYDIMILDEVFNHVDASGGEAIIEALQHLLREKSSIFVVEHDADFKSQFENRVVVEREYGVSRILEESDGEAKATQEEAQTQTAGTEGASNGKRKKKPRGKVRRKSVPSRKPVSGRRRKGTTRS